MKSEQTPVTLPARTRLAVVLRSLFIQATLNFEGMQNLGRVFCLIPVVRVLKLDEERFQQFIERHLSYFNSNPFISPLGLGAMARAEAEAAPSGNMLATSFIERFSLLLSTPLGAAGDALFWAAVRPQNVLLGTALVITVGPWGALAAIAGFMTWSIVFRWVTFQWGWAEGIAVSSVFKEGRLNRFTRFAGTGAALLAGFLVTFLYLWWGFSPGATSTTSVEAALPTVTFVACGVVSGSLILKQMHPVWALVSALGCIAVAMVIHAVAL